MDAELEIHQFIDGNVNKDVAVDMDGSRHQIGQAVVI